MSKLRSYRNSSPGSLTISRRRPRRSASGSAVAQLRPAPAMRLGRDRDDQTDGGVCRSAAASGLTPETLSARSRRDDVNGDLAPAVALDALPGDVAGPSLHSHSTTLATSSGWHTRPNGAAASSDRRSLSSRLPVTARARRTPMSVSTRPGATMLTWMPLRPLLLGQGEGQRLHRRLAHVVRRPVGRHSATWPPTRSSRCRRDRHRRTCADVRQRQAGQVMWPERVGGDHPHHLGRVGVGHRSPREATPALQTRMSRPPKSFDHRVDHRRRRRRRRRPTPRTLGPSRRPRGSRQRSRRQLRDRAGSSPRPSRPRRRATR